MSFLGLAILLLFFCFLPSCFCDMLTFDLLVSLISVCTPSTWSLSAFNLPCVLFKITVSPVSSTRKLLWIWALCQPSAVLVLLRHLHLKEDSSDSSVALLRHCPTRNRLFKESILVRSVLNMTFLWSGKPTWLEWFFCWLLRLGDTCVRTCSELCVSIVNTVQRRHTPKPLLFDSVCSPTV